MKRFLLLWLIISTVYSGILFALALTYPYQFNRPPGQLLVLYLIGLGLQFPIYLIGAKRLLGTSLVHTLASALLACLASTVVTVALAIALVVVGCWLFPHACHINLMPR